MGDPDRDLDQLIGEAYRRPGTPERLDDSLDASEEELEAIHREGPEALRRGVDPELLARLDSALKGEAPEVGPRPRADPSIAPRRWVAMVGIAAVAASVGLVIINPFRPPASPPSTPPELTAGNTLQIERGSPPASGHDLPAYGPSSRVSLLFEQALGSGDVPIEGLVVFRLDDAGGNLRLFPDIHLEKPEGRTRAIEVRAIGRALFGDVAGPKTLAFGFYGPGVEPTAFEGVGYAALLERSDLLWSRHRFSYQTTE